MSSRNEDEPGNLNIDKNKSIIACLFGSEETLAAAGDNNEVFNKPKESFERVRKDRMLENRKKCKASNGQDKSNSFAKSLTVEEILNRRKLQSESSLLEEIICMPIYPASDEDDESKEKEYETASLPIDVQIEETVESVLSHGLVLIRDAVPKSLVASISERANEIQQKVCNALNTEGIAWENMSDRIESFRFHEVSSRCSGRIDLRYETSKPPFSDMQIIENKSLLPIINSLLGAGYNNSEKAEMPVLVYAGLILSFPGSHDQPWHQDGMPLFPEAETINNLPPYALNIFFALDDVDGSLVAGPTEFIPKSHRLPEDQAMDILNNASKKRSYSKSGLDDSERSKKQDVVSPILKQGDALIYDYRICHRGTSNLTHSTLNSGNGKVRRILYLMYARPWFKEHLNFGRKKLFPA